MDRISFDDLALLLGMSPTELHAIVSETCEWLEREPPLVRVGHLTESVSANYLLDVTRDLMAIGGTAELVRRQRYRLGMSFVETIAALHSPEIRWRAFNARLLLELCGLSEKVANVVESQAGKLLKEFKTSATSGDVHLTRVFGRTPELLRALWERAERTGIDWTRLVETGELAPYQRADPKYSDMADFRAEKESTRDFLPAIESAAKQYGTGEVGWGIAYAFLSEFLHPLRGAFFEIEQEVQLARPHPHLTVVELHRRAATWSINYTELRAATEAQLYSIARKVLLFAWVTAKHLLFTEMKLRAICQGIIRTYIDTHFRDEDKVAALRLLPTGRCLCLAPVDPLGCCFSHTHESGESCSATDPKG
jgi:hypothetical protein